MIEKILNLKGAILKFLKVDISLKLMVVEAVVWCAFTRFVTLNIEFKRYNRFLGNKERELSFEGDRNGYRVAEKISLVVNKVADVTPWESKCLVRAITAQRMMKKRGYETTLYLGVGKDSEGMNAHAWIRYGKFYITGGNGKGHVKVAQFANVIKD